MRVDISLLPALAATFMLVFARVGAMVMLLPGLGETNIPVRIKLAIALLLTLIILPLHRAAYQIDLTSMSSLGGLMVHEIVIGIVLGATARVTLSALAVAGSVIAQQLGLGQAQLVPVLVRQPFHQPHHVVAEIPDQPAQHRRQVLRHVHPALVDEGAQAVQRRRLLRHEGVRRGAGIAVQFRLARPAAPDQVRRHADD